MAAEKFNNKHNYFECEAGALAPRSLNELTAGVNKNAKPQKSPTNH